MIKVLRVAQFGRYATVALDEARLVAEALGLMDNLLHDEVVVEALEAIVAVCARRLHRNDRFRRALLEAVARDLISVAGGGGIEYRSDGIVLVVVNAEAYREEHDTELDEEEVEELWAEGLLEETSETLYNALRDCVVRHLRSAAR